MSTIDSSFSAFQYSILKYSNDFVGENNKSKELNLRSLLNAGDKKLVNLRISGEVDQISIPERIVRGVLTVANDIEDKKNSQIPEIYKLIGVLLSRIPPEKRDKLIRNLSLNAKSTMDRCSATYQEMARGLMDEIREQDAFRITQKGVVKYTFAEELLEK